MKKKSLKKLLAIVLSMGIAASSMAGCGKSQEPLENTEEKTKESTDTEVAENSNVDLSEQVNVVIYVTGSEPDHFDKIREKLNEWTMRDLNCTVEYNFFNSSDTQQKYMMLLSSGEQIDLIYSGNWLNYSSYALRGAFQPIEDLAKEYSPKIYDYIGQAGWDAAKVNGTAYMIPCMWKEYNLFSITYREDLRKKHDLPVPDSVENIEKYLQGIKDNEPDIMPTLEGVQTAVADLGPYFRAIEVFDSKYNWVDWRMPYGIYIDYDDPTQTYNYWESDNFREDMKTMKRWADAGFWSRDALSNDEVPEDLMLAGKAAAQLGTAGIGSGVLYTERAKENDPDTEMEFVSIPYCYGKQRSVSTAPTQNGISVPITAQHADRAIAVYEKIMFDRDYFNLIMYGIEGEDYKVVDGKYESIPGGYTREASRLWCARTDEMYMPTEADEKNAEMKEKIAQIEGPNKVGGFVEDYTPYQIERTALMDVVTQYLVPIQAGMVDDVDAAIDEFLEKAKAAGMEKVQEGYLEQYEAYVASMDNWSSWSE